MKQFYVAIMSIFLLPLLISLLAVHGVQAQNADFSVSVEEVDESYPNYENAHHVVYTIDGEQGKPLVLHRGKTYTFDVNTPGHPFFLTTEQGGANNYSGEITEGVDNSRVQEGTLTFTVQQDLPDEIYYECGFHTNMGGVITVADSPEPEFTDFRAKLVGANQIPPVFTTAAGDVSASLNGSELTLSGSFEGLSSPVQPVAETGVHIHHGYTGQNGGVEVILNPSLMDGDTSGEFNETVTLSAAQLSMLQERQLYINIHTEAYPAGEIRGQLVPDGKSYFQTYASGGYSVPSNVSLGEGGLKLEWNGSDLTVTGAFSGLSDSYIEEVGQTGSGAHFHIGYAGENGPVEISLTPDVADDGLSGVFRAGHNTFENVDPDIVQTLVNRGHYLNIHTEAYPAGEIRGQIVPEADIYFYAPLSSGIENFGNISEGRGAVLLEWYGDDSEIVLTGSVHGLESDYNTEIGSHIHAGYAGQSGGAIAPNPLTLHDDARSGIYMADDNTIVFDQEDVSMLVNRQTYFNVHTDNWPGGEIRGQILPLAQHYFAANLTGESEVDPVQTEAFGGVAGELRGNVLTLSGYFAQLSSNHLESPGLHIHYGVAGENGGVAHPLTLLPDNEEDARGGILLADDNTVTLSRDNGVDELVQLATGGLYVNVHSEDYPAGEIRGQLLLDPNSAPVDNPEITAPMDGANMTLEGQVSEPFVPQWKPSDDPDGDRVVYLWQLALDDEFDNIVFSANTGTEQELPLTFGAVDALLDDLDVPEGTTVDLWHRALATDGSAYHIGTGALLTLERGVVTSVDPGLDLASRFELKQNYPNPFNPETQIGFSLPENMHVTLRVYDILGREVATLINEMRQAGTHNVAFDASSLSSGIYLYRIEAGTHSSTQKMMLTK